ncbi:hypothetical protein Cni_G11073 [Canna indica]|uniref:Lipase-like PAD4 n=1 Tax=Canna indica TaxID=4628 RepID=A0AAQ3Q963_9LILI|nr:hypothetical protein Cni_G11073 [Canna indica]
MRMDGRIGAERCMFETSHVLGALLASSPLLTQAWSHCAHVNAAGGGSSFNVKHCGDAVYVAFSGAPQTGALSSSSMASGLTSGGFFDPVPIYTAGHNLFAPLVGGEEGDDDAEAGRPMLVHAGALHLFLTFYHSSDFQLLISETRNKSVVLTGHSIGGCLASLMALYFLCSSARPNASSPASLLCITFGSPLLGNETLSRAILRERWGGRFCHVVAQHDAMPRLLFCPMTAMPPHLTTLVYNLMQSWHFSMHYPQFSRPALQLTEEQKAELSQYISWHISDAVAAADSKQPVSPYRPFGNYALCSAEGAVCIDDPRTVVKMLHLTFVTGDASGCIEEAHICYGDLVEKMLQNSQSKRTMRQFEEEEPKSNYCAGVSLALEASGIGIQDMGAMEARESLELSMYRRPKLNSASLAIKLAKVTPYRAQIEWYKASCDGDMGYYDCFKLRKAPKRDAKVNLNRIRLGDFWDELLDMLQNNKLPHDFLKRDKWVNAAQFYKLLVEPLDIAEYYRCQHHKTKGHYLPHGRERRYEVFDKWWTDDKEELAERRSKFAGLTQDSCFWAKVEEARECIKDAWSEKNPAKLVKLWESINAFESYANGLIARKEVSVDVLAPRSSYSLWVEELKELKLKQAAALHPSFRLEQPEGCRKQSKT